MTKSERTEMVPPLRRDLLPLMNDGAGNHYCLLIVGSTPEPMVVFWDHDLGADQEVDRVAGSFVEWMLEQVRVMDADDRSSL